jgi:predicted nicotinamide N-methyase
MASFLATALEMLVDVSYAAPQAHRNVNVELHQEYPPNIIFIFSHGRKYSIMSKINTRNKSS